MADETKMPENESNENETTEPATAGQEVVRDVTAAGAAGEESVQLPAEEVQELNPVAEGSGEPSSAQGGADRSDQAEDAPVEAAPAVSAAPVETTGQADMQTESVQEENQAEMDTFSGIKAGDLVKGKIVKIEDNQVLVDIGYKYDGTIPLRELSSLQIERASDVVELGQEVEVRVSSINDEKERLLLSKKAVDSVRAMDRLKQQFEAGEIIEAPVADVVKGGLVIDLGVRGFIPASMVERHFVEDFSDYKGRTLRLKIKELDLENNKVILSQKDVLDEEYEQNKKKVLESIQVGQEIEGTVQRLTPFGAFVDIGGIDGLVHISEMDYRHVEKPGDVVSEGQKARVKVLKLDPANEKISLSIKATQPGPWERVGSQFNVGQIVTGTVRRLVSFGAFIEIAPGVEGLVHISQIAHRHIGTPQEVLQEGQQVNVKILDILPAEKRVSLSIKETEDAPEQSERPERPERSERRNSGPKETYSSENVKMGDNQGLSLTLGERFGDKLDKFRK